MELLMITDLRSLFVTCAIIVIFLVLDASAQTLQTERVASGLTRPVFVTAEAGDTARLFVIEQRSGTTGRIRIIRSGLLVSRPFLSVPNLATGTEQGLLGLAFDPHFATNGYFFINCTRGSDGSTTLLRFRVSSDPDSADAASGDTLLVIPQPYTNHNGGMLAFGPDGYLYMGMGDGGSANDPENRAQSDTSLLGKLLRIDVDSAFPYAIPPTNPWADSPTVRHEIWAKGVRNPWRWSFDRQTHDLWIGDVGQDAWEEIDVQPDGSPGGQNYGWRCMEGFNCTGLTGCTCNDPSLTLPIYNYDHSGGKCAITGGYVYRGCAITGLQGTYFFADFCSNQIWSFRYANNTISEFTDRTAELAPSGGLNIQSISSFGEDANGELYICDLNDGEIFKILPTGTPGDCNCIAGAVTDLTVYPSGDNIELRWTANSGTATYNVYRAIAADAPFPGVDWTIIAPNLPAVAGPNAMSYTDPGTIPNADRFFYLVTAVCP
jgi:glucose/arabinose dehydrogenase